LGFGVQGLRFKVQGMKIGGLGFRVQDFEFSGFEVGGSGFGMLGGLATGFRSFRF
jgi:hypothetical protein